MDHSEKVLQLIRQAGPVVPSQISKEIGTDILLASAVLSDLASQKKVRISSVKFGGSPLYYLDGQEDKLQKYAEKLQEKEQKVFQFLKEQKVLRDSNLDPASRYAIRQIKDFAKPLEVTAYGNKEIFWKWYLLKTMEVEPLIKEELLRQPAELTKKEEVRREEAKLPEAQIRKQEFFRPVQEVASQNLASQLVEKRIPEIKSPVEEQKIPKKIIIPVIEKKTVESQVKRVPKQQSRRIQPRKSEKLQDDDTEFIKRITNFFHKNNIEIAEQTIKKKSEAEFIIKVPSAVGFLQYYCRAKNKKSCNEADLSEAYVQGQLKKLPTLFLTTGELTKTANVLLNNEQLSISFKKV